ncbi:acyltransferase [Lysinibacillus telephonicus]|uniref:Acyltransferase n=1 Tax=Lysinibacillus telephonicus TaxID=1714840 RepID=A0A3S0I107_9BACI|nr:acyltransferase [Lysinibacillus telephonicus]
MVKQLRLFLFSYLIDSLVKNLLCKERVVLNRIAYFDNAKAILIFLVVVGHMLSKFLHNDHLIDSIYLFIYMFHMPAFILISGYFSKKVYEPGYISKLVRKLILPYALLQVGYSLYYYFIFDDTISLSFFIPRWALWFLISLILWNILLYFFGKIKYGLPLAIIISLLIGYDAYVGEFLSISRTFFFFPFFLMGYYLQKNHFEKLKTRTNTIIGALLAVLLFVVIYFFVPIDFSQWLLGKRSYDEMTFSLLQFAWANRFVAYIGMAAATYMFLALVPRREVFFTSIGKNTMSIYLLHMALVRIFEASSLKTFIEDKNQYWIVFIIGLVIVYILSRPAIVKIVYKVCKVK